MVLGEIEISIIFIYINPMKYFINIHHDIIVLFISSCRNQTKIMRFYADLRMVKQKHFEVSHTFHCCRCYVK